MGRRKQLKKIKKKEEEPGGLTEKEQTWLTKTNDLIKEYEAEATLSSSAGKRSAVRVGDVSLGIPPHESKWENGKLAVRQGLWWAIALVLIDVLRITLGEGGGLGRYGWLSPAYFSLAASASWLTAAFAFGYFFTHVKGRTGVQKGAPHAL